MVPKKPHPGLILTVAGVPRLASAMTDRTLGCSEVWTQTGQELPIEIRLW